MEGTIKSPRPIPNIVSEATFSHRKPKKPNQRKLVEEDCLPPRAPVKSAPPISRVFKHARRNSVGALQVSFRDNGSGILLKEMFYVRNSRTLNCTAGQMICFHDICTVKGGRFVLKFGKY